MKTTIQDRLTTLRHIMANAGIDAIIIPDNDPHNGEYIATHWQTRHYLSGFTGSAGTLVVTAADARLWTDSRYFLQAGAQLDGTGITLMKDGLADTPSIEEWLKATLAKGQTVAIDGRLGSYEQLSAYKAAFEKAGLKMVLDFDPVTPELWPDRPAMPDCEVYVYDNKFAGRDAADKISDIIANVHKQDASSVIISDLAEVAWTLNIRSNDINYLPVATAHLYLNEDKTGTLFIDEAKLTDQVRAHLNNIGVTVRPYETLADFLSSLPENDRVLISVSQSSYAVAQSLGKRAVLGSSAVALLKAVKNEVEIEGERTSHIRDGVAMVRAISEIQATIRAGFPLTEMDIPNILLKYRKQGEYYVEESFETISGFGANGAIVHYAARPDTNKQIDRTSLLLIDSGANYLDGTTDITRTIALGDPTDAQRRDFTLVMKGHIALAKAKFPLGTRGHQLDALARMPLWKDGKVYLHGTGHGVGHFLSVHEGPQSVRLNDTGAPLLPGMIISNEPGFYLTDQYGIRCENLVLVVKDSTTEWGDFCAFETITLCPFDRNLFDTAIMTPEEIAWVNEYHETVCRTLAPLLEGEALAWLRNATRPL